MVTSGESVKMALEPRLLWLHGCVGIDGPDHRDPIAQVSYGEGHDANLGVGKVQPDVLRQIGQQLGVAGGVGGVRAAPFNTAPKTTRVLKWPRCRSNLSARQLQLRSRSSTFHHCPTTHNQLLADAPGIGHLAVITVNQRIAGRFSPGTEAMDRGFPHSAKRRS